MDCMVRSDYETLNRRIGEEAQAAVPGRSWLPSKVESMNDFYLHPGVYISRLPHFRSMLMTGGGIHWPDCPVPGYTWFSDEDLAGHLANAEKNIRGLRSTLESVLRKHDIPFVDFADDLIGAPYAYPVDGRRETSANLHNAFFYSLARHLTFPRTGTPASVLDVGGGFGGLLAKFAEQHPAVRCDIVELPRMAVIAGYYLGQRFDAEIVDSEESPASARVRSLMPWVFAAGRESYDLVLNTTSFQHMNAENQHFYFAKLAETDCRTLFSINRVRPTREGEHPFPEVAAAHGYAVAKSIQLVPWDEKLFAQVLVLQGS
jgi:putative sugar O-methyltransferase